MAIISRVIDHLRAAWDELTAPGAFFAMSEIEVRGIPMRVFDAAPPNMRVLWETTAAHADKAYVVYEDERYTYAEIDALVRALAHHLRDVHGVGSGDRVALAMRNYPEWVIGYWAITAIGAAVVGMNAWWTSPEMEYGLADSRPKVLIADDERLERVLPLLQGLRKEAPMHVIAVRSTRQLPDDAACWNDVIRPETAPAGLPTPTIDPDDDATIFYTSGTTGFPKGAQLTHRGSVHNIMHLMFWRMATDRGGRQGDRGRRHPGPGVAAGATRAAGVHGPDAAVPRHGVQLPAAPGDADRRAPRADLQVGPGAGARADRAGGRDELLGRADDEPRAAGPSGLGRAATRRRCRAWAAAGRRCSPTSWRRSTSR